MNKRINELHFIGLAFMFVGMYSGVICDHTDKVSCMLLQEIGITYFISGNMYKP